MEQAIVKAQAKAAPEQQYDEHLHARVVSWKAQSGNSVNLIAQKIDRSATAVSQYLNFQYPGNIPAMESDLTNLLRREEDLRFVDKPESFCQTSQVRQIWEILQHCKDAEKMGGIVGGAGVGKTVTALEFKRRHPDTILVTADITRRSLSALLSMIAFKNSGIGYGSRNADMLGRIVEDLRWTRQLIIIDEAHLLVWEAFEAIRTIYDQAQSGIVVLAMPRLYAEMKRNRSFLWDQILSRIAVKVSVGSVQKEDVQMLSDSIFPNLPKNCINFLYEISLGGGRFRIMCELLRRAVRVHETEHIPINLNLLKELSTLLVF